MPTPPPSTPPRWDCRWPDPIALKVAADRILRGRPPEDPAINRKLTIRVQVEPPEDANAPIRAILITPWGVERVYWSNPTQGEPPIQHAAPLEMDAEGRVSAGIGLLLESEGSHIPVLTAWEPEVGHHFVETLLHSVQNFSTVEEAMTTALGNALPYTPKRSITDHLNRTVSRRNLLGFFRG